MGSATMCAVPNRRGHERQTRIVERMHKDCVLSQTLHYIHVYIVCACFAFFFLCSDHSQASEGDGVEKYELSGIWNVTKIADKQWLCSVTRTFLVVDMFSVQRMRGRLWCMHCAICTLHITKCFVCWTWKWPTHLLAVCSLQRTTAE